MQQGVQGAFDCKQQTGLIFVGWIDLKRDAGWLVEDLWLNRQLHVVGKRVVKCTCTRTETAQQLSGRHGEKIAERFDA